MTPYEQIEAVNWSTLKHLATSAKLLAYRRDHEREDTRALRVGNAIHCTILEPHRLGTRYVVAPKVDRRTKKGKTAWAEWRLSIDATAEILTAEEYELVQRCADAARAHPSVRELLRGGCAEEVVTWTDEETGVACKGRLDYLAPAYLLDLKSTHAETLWQFAKEIAGRLYHAQAAFYFDGAAAARRIDRLSAQTIIVGIQTCAPFDVIPARLQVEDLEKGRALYRSLLGKYAACRAADWWPGLAPSVVDLPLPQWAPGGEPEQTGDEW